jgi:hypothetical protein
MRAGLTARQSSSADQDKARRNSLVCWSRKKQIRSKRLIVSIIAFGLVLCLVFSYQTILTYAANYLAPEKMEKSDVVILEGAEFIRERPVHDAMELLSSGTANRMVIVIKKGPTNERPFASLNYTRFITNNLVALGLHENQFQVITVPVNHPVTLTEAKIVLANLSLSNVRSVILMAEGFHSRRSFWAYKQVGTPLGIKIISSPYFVKYPRKTWWRTVDGCYEFISESLKLFYYVIMGYIPVNSLLIT